MPKKKKKELEAPNRRAILQTAVISLVFFVILFVLSTTNFGNQAGTKLDPTLALIALFPFIVWLIVSGRITEVVAPGGVAIKMHAEAQRPVSPELAKMPVKVDPARVDQKGNITDLNVIVLNRPTTLSFEIGRHNYYDTRTIWIYLDTLEMHVSEFRFIIFNEDGKFKGLMRVAAFKTVLPRDLDDLDSRSFVQNIESGVILHSPGVITDFVVETSTNEEALELMEKTQSDVLPLIDSDRRFLGVVTQDRIVRKIMTKLLSM